MKRLFAPVLPGPGAWWPKLQPLAMALLGLALALWLGAPRPDEVAALENAVATLQARLQHPPDPAADAASTGRPASEPGQTDAPAPEETASLWPWLQQGLQAHGLHVQALQPQPVTVLRGLPEQVLHLRLQGHWHDWLAWNRGVHARAPWWVIDQWQLLPAAAGQQMVRIELQARLALWPAAWPRAPLPSRTWPQWPATRADDDRAPLWLEPRTAELAGPAVRAASAATNSLPDDPRDWPVAQLRLLGVWRQGTQAHAVLGQGLQQIVVRQGQRIGREGHRVGTVGENEVALHPPQNGGPVLHLKLQ